MRENRESIMKHNMAITDNETRQASKMLKKQSYPEDRAYHNHLKTKSPKDFSITERQALMRIAGTGLDMRASLDGMIQAKTIELTDKATPNMRRLALQEVVWMMKQLRGDIV